MGFASLSKQLGRLVYGSNLIERAGSSRFNTLSLANAIFQGYDIKEEIAPSDDEYAEWTTDVVQNSAPSSPDAVSQSCGEVVQHCLALLHMLRNIVTERQPLTESLILECHRILTYKVAAPDGTCHEEYGGRYRTDTVSAGLKEFTKPDLISRQMRDLIADYSRDTAAAADGKDQDPYELAAKYCHLFVNIHPFLDGNGRMCRIILNAILLRHAGKVAVLGETEKARDKYLTVAANGSLSQEAWDEADDEEREYMVKPWDELATLVKDSRERQDTRSEAAGIGAD